jgi:hypothetical protein
MLSMLHQLRKNNLTHCDFRVKYDIFKYIRGLKMSQIDRTISSMLGRKIVYTGTVNGAYCPITPVPTQSAPLKPEFYYQFDYEIDN